MNFKGSVKKLWNLLWHDNSWKGWIFSIIILFIFIKFIFLPGLTLITGTSLPLAIVESCSMYHSGADTDATFERWWKTNEGKYEELSITKENFKNYIFKNGFNKGEILFLVKATPSKLKIGDIITFQSDNKVIIHRIINIKKDNITEKYTFSTMGDNNNGQLSQEISIQENQLVGKAFLSVAPYIGWFKLIFFEGVKSPSEKGFCREN